MVYNRIANPNAKGFESERRFLFYIGIKVLITYGKPAPDVIIEAFRRIGINPKEGLVVGDSENDVLSGKGAGAITALVCSDKQVNTKADFVISNIAEILNLIK